MELLRHRSASPENWSSRCLENLGLNAERTWCHVDGIFDQDAAGQTGATD
jgi:hypothetical protein